MVLVIRQFQIALRNIVRQRRRSLLAIGAITFGVVALLFTSGFIESILHQMKEWTIRSRLGHIQVSRSGYAEHGLSNPYAYLLPVGGKEKAEVAAAPDVLVIGERLDFTGLISHGEITKSFIGEGVEPNEERQLTSTLIIESGGNLSNSVPRGVIIGAGLADNLGVKVGDAVVLMATPPGRGMNAIECVVVGTFRTTSKAYDDVTLRVPIDAARSLVRVRGSHKWVILLKDTENTESTLSFLRQRFSSGAIEFVPWFDLADFYRKTVALFSQQIFVMKAIIATIIILGIGNTMMMNVMERTGEIGTSMALGTARRAILWQFSAQSILLGVLGSLIGVGIALLVAETIAQLGGIPMPPPPGMAVGYSAFILITPRLAGEAVVLTVVATFLAGIYPAWKASHMQIVNALRHNR